MFYSTETIILILNWNNWKDTIECLESLVRIDQPSNRIILVDNDSSDNSVEYIVKYLKGELCPTLTEKCPIYNNLVTKRAKGISYVVISEDEAHYEANNDMIALQCPHVTIIRNKKNYGFAKGNNVGLRFALNNYKFEYVWLLNNDTVVEKCCLDELVNEAKTDPKNGIIGSIILYYDRPDLIQAAGGGRFYTYFGLTKLFFKNNHRIAIDSLTKEMILANINYLMGASLLIKRSLLKDIGLFDEDFFLFTEEVDLAFRAKDAKWKLSIAKEGHVFHKESASTKNQKQKYYYLLNWSNLNLLGKRYGKIRQIIAVPFMLMNTIRLTQKTQNILYSVKGIYDCIVNKKADADTLR